MPEIVLVRHGETEWSRDGKHTGRTDVPLTDVGRAQAERLRGLLAGRRFASVLTSPLSRAADTCAIAGFGAQVEHIDDLMEWDYGDYEGRTTADIRAERPGWSLWTDGCPDGETPADVGRRADAVIDRLSRVDGDVLVFGHAHMLRVLGARWIGLTPSDGRLFAFDTARLSVLGHERETTAVVRQWNCAGVPVDAS